MLFNSIDFLIFFPVVALLYFQLPHRWRWIWLLIASYYFYMYWRVDYAMLLVISTVVDFFVAKKMGEKPTREERRPLLWISLTANLSLLFFFKYFNFFNREAAELAARMGFDYAIPALNVLLPVGISFYTFQTLSYTIDVYRGDLPAEKSLPRFALYIVYFPQLVAGPIERATRLIPQLREEVHFDYERAVSGLKQMIWGFFKKVVVADRLSLYVDSVYNNPGDHQGLPLILATYFFAFQIYADFSGYSDIAIGASRILGFELMQNFRRPYLARSISEFWSRWHISLSTWFRDYLYIPLGGNRVGKGRWYLNLFVVFAVSGVWHGANWTFMIWGVLHGAYLVLALMTHDLRERLASGLPARLVAAWEIFIVFHLALVAWVFFRAASISDAATVFTRSLEGLGAQLAALVSLDARYLDALLVGGVGVSRLDFVLSLVMIGVLYITELGMEKDIVPAKWKERPWLRMLWYDLLVMVCLLFGVFGQAQFIYFQF